MHEDILPTHVGIIMDGNGRWATKRGLSRTIGHKMGAKNLEKLLKHIQKRKIKYLSIYAFSSENFKRSSEEVDGLMKLFLEYFTSLKSSFIKEGVRVVFSGRKDNLSLELIQAMDNLEKETEQFTNGCVNILLNYGSRNEILDMTKNIASKVLDGRISIDDISTDTINENLYHCLPDLDLIIRTGGEYRLSNFMLWQASYAEFYFTDVYFPDFDGKEFDLALEEYCKRKRRFGGV